ncbi:TrmH family RNA methyltransferase [Bacteroidota bacterium]
MISLSQIKSYKSLQIKKYRQQAQKFLVEGSKSVLELLKSEFNIEIILATRQFLANYGDFLKNASVSVEEVSEKVISRISQLKTNESVLAVVNMPADSDPPFKTKENIVALDSISDPGNLGTILRIADWYGIKTILASEDTVELYNPKVIQASMGSFTRTRIYYGDLKSFFKKFEQPVIGTYMEGEDVHDFHQTDPAIILFGNESSGINPELDSVVDHKLTIPRTGQAESLNVAISCAVVLDNLTNRASF